MRKNRPCDGVGDARNRHVFTFERETVLLQHGMHDTRRDHSSDILSVRTMRRCYELASVGDSEGNIILHAWDTDDLYGLCDLSRLDGLDISEGRSA